MQVLKATPNLVPTVYLSSIPCTYKHLKEMGEVREKLGAFEVDNKLIERGESLGERERERREKRETPPDFQKESRVRLGPRAIFGHREVF